MSGGIAIVGAGAVTAAGTGLQSLADALGDPDFAVRPEIERPDAPPLPVLRCATFDPRASLPPMVLRRLDRPARLLTIAAYEALAVAGDPLPWPADRVGVAAGTWNAGTAALVEVLRAVFLASPEEAPPGQFPSTVANAPASQFGLLARLSGPNLTFFEKQVGGLRAVAEAARCLTHGRATAMIAAGVDEAQWLNAEGYQRLGALRTARRPGMLLGEGAAALLLTADGSFPPLARLGGAGSWSVPAPTYRYPDDPASLVVAIRRALAAADLPARAIDLIVAASNGLPQLDRLERAALETVFGPHRPAVVAPSMRLGEGAFSGTVRILVAALAVGGRAALRWDAPPHLASAGFRAIAAQPGAALVFGLAGGGSAVALVITP